MHWNGSTWISADPGVTDVLRGVGGTAANDVWLVGANGAAVHWDGTDWTANTMASGVYFQTIAGSSDGSLWAAGTHGAILRRAP